MEYLQHFCIGKDSPFLIKAPFCDDEDVKNYSPQLF